MRLTDCSISKKNLLELGNLQRLTVLYLTGFEVDVSLSKTIGTISGLQELFFSDCQLNDRNLFKELSQLKHLNSLDLRKSSLADIDQSQLKQIRSLKILRTTELSDELAKSLKASSIETFQIDRNPFITNQDILKLSRAPKLKSIQVMECPKVSDVVVGLFKQRNSKCQVVISNSFSSLVN